ncbi:MAG: aminotransferase class III-fold pyridoxal phosphate-dependent enzyme, partial [Sarcina sp.]
MLNSEVFKESSKFMPGGVNSPVRAYKGLDIDPPIIESGKGAYIYDVEGNKYLDFVGAWGPMILGHCNQETVEAIKNEAERALAFGAPTFEELKLAKY